MKRVFIFVILFLFSFSYSYADSVLSALGAASASSLYLTYVSIGVIGDAYEGGVYNAKKSKSLINGIVGQTKVVKRYLNNVLSSGSLSRSDKRFLSKMIKAYSYLIDEGYYLVKYISTKKQSAANNFHSNRKKAWQLIAELLGLN